MSLVSHWKLDESSGLVASNSADVSVSGVLENMVGDEWITSGVINNALTFDGVDDGINCGDVYNYERTQPFSMSMWLNTGDGSGQSMLAGRYKSAAPFKGYMFHTEDTKVRLLFSNNDLNEHLWAESTGSVVDSTWHHVAVTYDGTSDVTGVVFYIDGAISATVPVLNTLNSSIKYNGTLFYLGRREGAANNIPFVGSLDDVRLYNHVLSQGEITALYKMTSAGVIRRRRIHVSHRI